MYNLLGEEIFVIISMIIQSSIYTSIIFNPQYDITNSLNSRNNILISGDSFVHCISNDYTTIMNNIDL